MTIFIDEGPNKLLMFRINYDNPLYGNFGSFNNDKWFYTTFILSNSSIKIYLNGILNSLKEVPTYTTNKLSSIFLGANPINHNNHNFNGLIDDLNIYNRTLNESEIRKLYKMGTSR